jgi:hypothetical protein
VAPLILVWAPIAEPRAPRRRESRFLFAHNDARFDRRAYRIMSKSLH